MPPVVIDLQNTEDPRDAIHRAVQALAEGQVVGFPTEALYVLSASALCDDAVRQMAQAVENCTMGENPAKRASLPHQLTLAIKSADEALDYVPDLAPLPRRLARRCWPGPITLAVDDAHPDSLLQQLPPPTQQLVMCEGALGLSVPSHPVIHAALRLSSAPLVIADAVPPSNPAPPSGAAQAVAAAHENRVALVLDDGPAKFGQPASLVRVKQRQVQVLRSGVFSDAAVRRLSSLMVVFVCTGNTCRSPMAEVLMKQQVARRLGCSIEQLENRGVLIVSAGISAMTGGRAAPEAMSVMGERGLDLSAHESQLLSERLLRFADLILGMTHSHVRAILTQSPQFADRTQLLCHDGDEVPDPIGGPIEEYRRCADHMQEQLAGWVEKLNLDELPTFSFS